MGNAIGGEEVAVVGQDRMHKALAAQWGRLTDAARQRVRMAGEERAGFTPTARGFPLPRCGLGSIVRVTCGAVEVRPSPPHD